MVEILNLELVLIFLRVGLYSLALLRCLVEIVSNLASSDGLTVLFRHRRIDVETTSCSLTIIG